MSPHKIQAVAVTEFTHLIGTRVFQLSLVLVPAFALGLSYLSKSLGPLSVAPTGAADPSGAWLAVGSMGLLFLMVMLTTPQMMSSVIEEKMSRISEVLLASVSPFDLMLGKLLACSAVAALVSIIYGALGLLWAAYHGQAALMSLGSVLIFAVFLVLAVFLHGSMYMAVGAACSEPKDAQGMLAPLVLLTAVPLVTVKTLLHDPHGGFATVLSYFPLSAPFVMAFRLNSPPGPPLAELLISVGVILLSTLFCVWAASRIFRVGLLAQGKAPSLGQLWRWVFAD